MKGFKKELIFITLGIMTPLLLHTLEVNAGSFGAEIFALNYLRLFKNIFYCEYVYRNLRFN